MTENGNDDLESATPREEGIREANRDITVIRSKEEMDFCPKCGEATERVQTPVEVKIVCPEHGQLLIDHV
jgi:NADH pyrophosphatase NudC (nudix superfamily)